MVFLVVIFFVILVPPGVPSEIILPVSVMTAPSRVNEIFLYDLAIGASLLALDEFNVLPLIESWLLVDLIEGLCTRNVDCWLFGIAGPPLNGEAGLDGEVVFSILSFGFSVGLAGMICTVAACCGKLCDSKLLCCCSFGVGDLIVLLEGDDVAFDCSCSVFDAIANGLPSGEDGLAAGEGSGV